jgi:hypothetical protein
LQGLQRKEKIHKYPGAFTVIFISFMKAWGGYTIKKWERSRKTGAPYRMQVSGYAGLGKCE